MALLLLGVTLLYGHTLAVPWYLDDYRNLLENPLLRDPAAAFGRVLHPRGIVIASFALNYRFGGLDPTGYHLVNIALHAVNVILVWRLLLRLLPQERRWACGGALLFALHPLQTQAVTYTVQRMSVLAALFFLLALTAWLAARAVRAAGAPFTAPRHLLRYGTALGCGALAVLTKENTAVLPLLLWLWPRFFPDGDRIRLGELVPFLLVPLWCAWLLVGQPLAGGAELHSLGHARVVEEAGGASLPLRYLVTEFSVLWLYLRLFVLPFGQALDYGYPLTATLLAPAPLLAGGGLLALAATAWAVRNRAPLVTAGLTWFFITLAVESTVIPLDPVFEHRLYLPLFGLVLVVLGLLQLLPPRRALPLLFLLPLLCAPLTWQRNALWRDPIALYQDNLRQTPGNRAVVTELGRRYLERNDVGQAEQLLTRTLQQDPADSQARMSLSKLYIDQGRNRECIELLNPELLKTPVPKVVLANLATAYFNLGNLPIASNFLAATLSVDPDFAPANALTGRILLRQQRWSEAEGYLRRALWMDATNPDYHFRHATALYNLGRFAECRSALLRANKLRANDPDTLFHLGLLAGEHGEQSEARQWLERLAPIDAAKAEELRAALAQH